MSDETEKVCPHCSEGFREVRHSGTGESHRVKCFCQEEIPISVVLQPEDSGCAVAAVATVAGISYKEARALLRMDRDLTTEGSYDFEIQEMLDFLGFASQIRYSTIRRLNGARRLDWMKPWAPVHIATVRSLSNTGTHFVVMLADGRVLDPWWGVVQGLHRYSEVFNIIGFYRISEKATP